MRNPMRYHQVSKVTLKPDVVDGIVFWTKNPAPMLGRLNELDEYMYYFQFTVTPYGSDIEPNVPAIASTTLQTYKRLADFIGPERVIWRYDPILFNDKYTYAYHIKTFAKIAGELRDYTKKVIYSFIDTSYRGVRGNLKELALHGITTDMKIKMSSELAGIAHDNNLIIETCAEELDLSQYGISRSRCIDDRLFTKLIDCNLDLDRDKNQRLECGCVTSIDIGMYNSCMNGCLYCYANYKKNHIAENSATHDINSPLILGNVCEFDKITEREVKSNRNAQISFRL